MPCVHAIERVAFRDPWSLGQLAACLGEGGVFLVAELGGRFAGYVIAQRAADEAEILNLAVDPVARRHGVGRALVREALTALAARGARTVYLEVRESNAAARRLYEAAGFTVSGRRRGYYRTPPEDAIVLRTAILADGGNA